MRPAPPAGLRVALVHDWLTGMRGGEKCLEVLAEIFPDADLFTLLHVPGSVVAGHREPADHHLLPAELPGVRAPVPLGAAPVSRGPSSPSTLCGYDLVLSSSHCVAKGAVPAPGALSDLLLPHAHALRVGPLRRLLRRTSRRPCGTLIGWQAGRLRRWDRRTAPRVHRWLANSTVVRQRLLDWYGVAAGDGCSIVFPPVDVARFAGARTACRRRRFRHPAPTILSLSALVPYKRIDLAVQARRRRPAAPWWWPGTGPERRRLRGLARTTPGHGPRGLRWVRWPMTSCRPGTATAGASSSPAWRTSASRPWRPRPPGGRWWPTGPGGVLDTVREGLNGIFFDEQTVAALAEALADPRLDGPGTRRPWSAHAAGFDRERYRREMDRGHRRRPGASHRGGEPAGNEERRSQPSKRTTHDQGIQRPTDLRQAPGPATGTPRSGRPDRRAT